MTANSCHFFEREFPTGYHAEMHFLKPTHLVLVPLQGRLHFPKVFLAGENVHYQTAGFLMVYSDVDFTDASAAVVLI